MRESAVEALFVREVKKHGGMTSKLAPTDKGIPDRLAIMPGGRIYLVELKAEGGRTSPAQDHWHTRAAERGVSVVVLTGPEQVRSWFTYIEGTDTP